MQGKRILLGLTGSIAAFKTAELVRLFKKAGAEVQVIATASAFDFITATTLSTVSENPVLSEFIKNKNGEWNNHVALGLWADVMIIAPLTANSLAKMSTGICDNLLLATYLSARCPVFIAPAMDLDMYQHHTANKNLETVQSHGINLIPAEHGELASGLIGTGRMAEPETIFNAINSFFLPINLFQNKKVLVTAGPTHEKIDAVRFIGNSSSGKMGFEIAKAFALQGAEVTLISGPTNEVINAKGITRINVVSAEEMLHATMNCFKKADIIVMSAAVADFTPKDIERILLDTGIIRNRLKVVAAVNNAKLFINVQKEFGSFDQYLYSFILDGKSIQNEILDSKQTPATSVISDAIAKDMKKRGFKFFGSTICYAFMQATGMVNDHAIDCDFK